MNEIQNSFLGLIKYREFSDQMQDEKKKIREGGLFVLHELYTGFHHKMCQPHVLGHTTPSPQR